MSIIFGEGQLPLRFGTSVLVGPCWCRDGVESGHATWHTIARRAGFAPQTLYRWFKDKTDVFMAVYRESELEEKRSLDALSAVRASSPRLVDAIVGQHRAYRILRRSLPGLSLSDPRVRSARAQSRLHQIASSGSRNSSARKGHWVRDRGHAGLQRRRRLHRRRCRLDLITDEIVGDGHDGTPEDVGNLVVVSGALPAPEPPATLLAAVALLAVASLKRWMRR